MAQAQRQAVERVQSTVGGQASYETVAQAQRQVVERAETQTRINQALVRSKAGNRAQTQREIDQAVARSEAEAVERTQYFGQVGTGAPATVSEQVGDVSKPPGVWVTTEIPL